MHSLLWSTSLTRNGTFLTKKEPTVTYHYYPKSIVYLTSVLYAFYAFEKMYGINPSLQYLTVFSLPKTPPCSAYFSLLTPTHGNHWYFYCLHSFLFSRILYGRNDKVLAYLLCCCFIKHLCRAAVFELSDSFLKDQIVNVLDFQICWSYSALLL